MTDFGAIAVSCSEWREIVSAVNAVNRALPLEMRQRLNKVFTSYFARHGLEGVYERMNNRTVAQILTEFRPEDEPKAIASGEVDGVRYRLYDPPSPQAARDEPKPDNK